MDMKVIDEAVVECKRFLSRVVELKARVKREDELLTGRAPRPGFSNEYQYKFNPFYGCAESAAVKRASMDLSRALVKLR